MCGGIIAGALALLLIGKLVSCGVRRRCGYARTRHRGERRGFGKRFMLRWLFERLDTTPGQEKVIAASFDVIREALSKAKSAFKDSRSKIADALRGDEFGHEAIGDAWVSHDSALEAARLEVVTELQKIHDALDEGQRELLAKIIESGPRGHGPFGWDAGEGAVET